MTGRDPQEMTVLEASSKLTDPQSAPTSALENALGDMVDDSRYPCLGARSVFRRDGATVRVYQRLADPACARVLLEDLRQFASTTDPQAGFASFVAVFRAPAIDDEKHFERLLWTQLNQLHAADDDAWNAEVSDDPTDEHFAFSAGGTAYFIVGLHPRASRVARRSPTPILVFNLHEQFDMLRASGAYPRLRDKIRERDQRLQGSTNPMVADYGASSEASQYSGRRVGPGWEAPFPIDEQRNK